VQAGKSMMLLVCLDLTVEASRKIFTGCFEDLLVLIKFAFVALCHGGFRKDCWP
jgi:hypothetical protein